MLGVIYYVDSANINKLILENKLASNIVSMKTEAKNLVNQAEYLEQSEDDGSICLKGAETRFITCSSYLEIVSSLDENN